MPVIIFIVGIALAFYLVANGVAVLLKVSDTAATNGVLFDLLKKIKAAGKGGNS